MVQEKKLVDEVSGWLRAYDEGSVDRAFTGPPEVKFMAEAMQTYEEFIEGVATRDVTIESNSGRRAGIYLPEQIPTAKTKLPNMLHFHGVGFCSQADWYMYYHIYTRLARSLPAICVSIYLRLALENRLPPASDDANAALLWLWSLAKSESHESLPNDHADFNNVFLIGDSTGGNIVHQVAARAGNLDLSPLRLVGGILIHPGFVRAELEQPESPFLTLDMVDKFLAMALPPGSSKNHPITCPMGPVAPPMEGLNLPPFLLCVAETELIKDTEME